MSAAFSPIMMVGALVLPPTRVGMTEASCAKCHKQQIYIPKADGRQRPIGIAALEDKIVQQAVGTILNAIYEVDFRGFSYGFRPGRSPHQALDALNVGIQRKRVNWILDADIRGFFDNMDHGWTMKFVGHRVADNRVLRLIQKWLKAGVLEDMQTVTHPATGTPQGGVISPILANIYLHYALDMWFQKRVQKQLQGKSVMMRYADDFVILCRTEGQCVYGSGWLRATPTAESAAQAARPHQSRTGRGASTLAE